MTSKKIQSINPTTGEVVKVFDSMTSEEVNGKTESAYNEFLGWKNTDYLKRKQFMKRLYTVMEEQKMNLASLSSLEMGKLLYESLEEVEICLTFIDYYINHLDDFLSVRKITSTNTSCDIFIRKEPLGVVLSVQPWNFPYYQVFRSAIPAILAGNTVLLKHVSTIPQCAEAIEELFKVAKFPKGVYTNLFLPGSERAGSAFAEAAGKHLIKSTLELGGSDPLIVTEDYPIEKAVEVILKGCLANTGQICTSSKRIIIYNQMYAEVIEALKKKLNLLKIGAPMDVTVSLGPMSSENAREKVLNQIEQSVAMGAVLSYGGKKIHSNGYFMILVILTEISKTSPAYQEELFGPVFSVFKVSSDEEAIHLANDTSFGLGASIFSKDKQRAIKIGKQIESGMVTINTLIELDPAIPFGGRKCSGYGREHGEWGFDEFVDIKVVKIRRSNQ